MRIVVDTNILFSAMLNTNSKISYLLLAPRSNLNFYATKIILEEINNHSEKLKKIAGYNDQEFERILEIFRTKIKFINPELIPKSIFKEALILTEDVDIDDTELIALTEHIKGKFWSGDKVLILGLEKKHWKKFITTEVLFSKYRKKR